ncbi:HAD family hydrolase [Gorillibacterium sp. sgz5001074]|uniref:HAD family hydrolase n=1 Tax=Gorillibacterium sp. sgz5001074 TaxID=3446695 RepID=UPI003F66B081
MMPQTILFDLDDTLIHCNKYFDAVLDQFADLLSVWFGAHRLGLEDIKKKQLEIDIAGVNIHGFTTDHFPVSLVKTYEYFSNLYGRERSQAEEEELLALGKSVYDLEVEPYPSMVETLDRLQADGHRLYLYTGGVTAHQHKKIKSVQLEKYFGDRIFVRQHKTAEALEEIVREMSFDRSSTWMIGNSIRTDVVPALKAGLNCIHIPAIQEWEYNNVEITEEPKGVFLRLQALSEVPDAISHSIVR